MREHKPSNDKVSSEELGMRRMRQKEPDYSPELGNVRTLGDYEAYMKKAHPDVYFDKSMAKITNIEALKESTAGIERVMEDFPEIAGFWGSVAGKRSGIMAVNGRGDLYFNPLYYGSMADDQLRAVLAKNVASGWFPKNTATPWNTGVHEAGHLTVGSLRRLLFPLNERGVNYKGAEDYDKSILDKDIIDAAVNTINQQGRTTRQLIEEISRNSKEDYSEAVADAFNDWYTNKGNSAPLSQVIVSELKRRLSETRRP